MDAAFGRLARTYFERAEDAMRMSAAALYWLIWLSVAGVIIYFIFTIFVRVYLGALRSVM
jgi:hypothetical protein